MNASCVVIIDKPFARTSAEADRVIKLADEKGLIVTCYQNRRWVSFIPRASYHMEFSLAFH